MYPSLLKLIKLRFGPERVFTCWIQPVLLYFSSYDWLLRASHPYFKTLFCYVCIYYLCLFRNVKNSYERTKQSSLVNACQKNFSFFKIGIVITPCTCSMWVSCFNIHRAESAQKMNNILVDTNCCWLESLFHLDQTVVLLGKRKIGILYEY